MCTADKPYSFTFSSWPATAPPAGPDAHVSTPRLLIRFCFGSHSSTTLHLTVQCLLSFLALSSRTAKEIATTAAAPIRDRPRIHNAIDSQEQRENQDTNGNQETSPASSGIVRTIPSFAFPMEVKMNRNLSAVMPFAEL